MQRFSFRHMNVGYTSAEADGQWVRYADASKEISAAYESGVANGKGISATDRHYARPQLNDYRLNAEVEYTSQWTPPGVKLRGTSADVIVNGKHVNQLLNEVYHDRARLEAVVERSVELLTRYSKGVKEDIADGTIESTLAYTWQPLLGETTEFVKANGA